MLKTVFYRKPNSRLPFVLFFLAFVLPCVVFAQRVAETPIRIDTDLVAFDVTVTDADGRPVRGLEARDFRIFEDNVERPVEFFDVVQKAGEERPVAVVFALDVSGSVTVQELESMSRAMRIFVERFAGKNASFAVLTFGMKVNLLQGLTSDHKKLEKAYRKLLRETDGLSTHAYDAVDYAIRLLNREAPRTRGQLPVKKSVILVTDGFPVGDIVSPKTVIERANQSDVSVYSVTTPSFSRWQTGKKPLPTVLDVSGLIEKTGGKNFYATDTNFEPFFRALAETVASSYLLAFYPKEEKGRDGQFRKVRIEITREGLTLKQNRDGYQFAGGL
jgi:VWFA-related protein